MHHYTLSEARHSAQGMANDLGEAVRVIAFDYQPVFEGEQHRVMYAIVNVECTHEQMFHAGYVNARVCIRVEPEQGNAWAVKGFGPRDSKGMTVMTYERIQDAWEAASRLNLWDKSREYGSHFRVVARG